MSKMTVYHATRDEFRAATPAEINRVSTMLRDAFYKANQRYPSDEELEVAFKPYQSDRPI